MGSAETRIGDTLALRHGPFVSHWRVIALETNGARLVFTGTVEFVGFTSEYRAPNGTYLAGNRQEFVGGAHLASVKIVDAWPGRVDTGVLVSPERVDDDGGRSA